MKRFALGLLLVVLAAGCGSGKNLAGTQLKLTAFNADLGKAVFHLDCAPAGGDVTDVAAACAALRGNPKLVTAPKPYVCSAIGWADSVDVTISGRLTGQPVRQKFSTCWTPQMPTLGKLGVYNSLGRHVLPRRHGRVAKYSTRVFPPGALRPGDFVTCRVGGHRLEIGIPNTVGPAGSTGYGGVGIVGARFSVTRRADGSITASCHRGGS